MIIISVNLVIDVFRVKHESPKNNRFSCFIIFGQALSLFRQFSSLLCISLLGTHTPSPDKLLRDISFQLLRYFALKPEQILAGTQHSAGRPSHVSSLTRLFADPPKCAAVSLR